jgi:hypothetical protein
VTTDADEQIEGLKNCEPIRRAACYDANLIAKQTALVPE